MREEKPQMHEQWKCERCNFPENFMNDCAMCGDRKAVIPPTQEEKKDEEEKDN